jgi:CubicO group peptidase (beta-lactamase class C family)
MAPPGFGSFTLTSVNITRPHTTKSCLALTLLFAVVVTASGASQTVYPGRTWERASGSQREGWSEKRLALAKQYSQSIGSSAVMVIQHGRVIAEWGAVDRKMLCYSIRKSLLSSLYGIYAEKGAIHLDATLAQLGIDDVPPLTLEEKSARLVDLLRARSGVYHAVPFETRGMTAQRPARGSHAPGTFWYYNNWDFDALGFILEKETGQQLGPAFAQQVAGPLQMQDFLPSDVFYLHGPESIMPAFQFRMSARDLARFGLLYLRQGRWNNHQIVPGSWVEKSSHTHEMVSAGGREDGGYEYLWWVQYKGIDLPNVELPEGTYSARGAGGHYLLIIPALDMVIVHHAPNEPASDSLKDVTAEANHNAVSDAQFGALVKMVLAAYQSR